MVALRGWVSGALIALLAAGSAAAQSSAVKHEAWSVAGLSAPAQMVVDHWGIPHIFARDAHDAFFLQGYNAARDRLWQIDLWRKRGLGRLSASFGPSYVAQDRAARLFLYRGDMAAEWAAYDPQSRTAVEAFAAGVNAYVAEVKAGKRPLPLEFKLTASQPEAWAAEDILRIRSHALVSNVTSEVARAQVACKGGLAADTLRRKLEPAHETVVPKGLDPCVVPADVLKDYLLATEPVSFEALAAGGRKAEVRDPQVQLASAMDAYQAEGSNNWVIAPSRTATGRPILANDPHRPVGAPSLRYIVHLNAPDLDIIGAGEPALPGVSFGHNGQVAWGLTIFYIDQEDLYVYDAPNSGKNGGDAYRYKGKLEPMKVVHETIEVKGETARDVTLKFTRHGPVLDETSGHAFAMRTVWAEPGASGYFGSSRMWRARSWTDFKAGQEHWGVPPLNLVFADASGDIGWSAAGLTPVRPNWDGLMPVPGDGRYEWAGLRPEAELPNVHNPAEGFFATANDMNLPAGYKNPTGYEWADRSRITRIKEVLTGLPKSTLADSMALQTDSHDALSRRTIALLKPLTSPDPQVQKALDLLRAWDNDETTASAAAAIYQVWVSNHLGHTVVQSETPEAARTLVGSGSVDAVVTWLETPQAAPKRDALLLASLTATVKDLERGLGPDMATWSWGRLHHADFTPSVAVLADRQTARQMSTGALEVPGSASSPRAATYNPSTFDQTAGASVRLVMDVGAWDNSVAVNTPGQSGDPMSVHYRDLFPLWAAGSYVPLDFSRAAIDRDAELIVSLTPGK